MTGTCLEANGPRVKDYICVSPELRPEAVQRGGAALQGPLGTRGPRAGVAGRVRLNAARGRVRELVAGLEV